MNELGSFVGSFEHWAFFVLSSAAAFLAGRLLATGRRVSCAIDNSKRIPELLEASKAILRAQDRNAVYLKHLIRLDILCAAPPADVDAAIRRIQSSLTEDLESLR